MRRTFLSSIGSELYRECISVKYFFVVLGIAVLIAFCNYSEIEAALIYPDAREMFSSSRSLSAVFYMEKFKAAIVVVLSAVVAVSVSEDCIQNFSSAYQVRMSAGLYVLVKVISNYFVCVITMILGIWLYFILMIPVMPIGDSMLEEMRGQYGVYVDFAGNPFLYGAIMGSIFGGFAACLAGISMAISFLLPNRHLALAIPFMLLYVSYIATMNTESMWNPMDLISGMGIFLFSSTGMYLYTMGIFATGNLLVGIGFYIEVRWRWRNA